MPAVTLDLICLMLTLIIWHDKLSGKICWGNGKLKIVTLQINVDEMIGYLS